jgi:hypothetical protein
VVIVGCVVAVAITAVVWGVLQQRIAAEQQAVDGAEREHTALRARIGVTETDLHAFAATVRRAVTVSALLTSHRVWTPFFATLEARTLPGVTYESMAADAMGSVTLSASAPDVRTAAEQLVAWRAGSGVQAVEVSGLTTVADELGVVRGVRFDLRMTFDPHQFTVQPDPASARAGT